MWVEVSASAALAEGQCQTVEVSGRAVALVRKDGVVYALDDTCPHRGGSMGQGALDGFHLVCPLHAWCFDVRDGRAFFPKGVALTCFTARERDGRIEVTLSRSEGEGLQR